MVSLQEEEWHVFLHLLCTHCELTLSVVAETGKHLHKPATVNEQVPNSPHGCSLVPLILFTRQSNTKVPPPELYVDLKGSDFSTIPIVEIDAKQKRKCT